MNTRELKLVNGCPKWCTEDHTVQAGEDREHHNGTVRELRLPGGRLALEASLTLEPGTAVPQLVVSGSVGSFMDDVQLLGLADAKAFEAEVQRFASHVSRMTATLRVAEAQQPRPKKPNPGQLQRAAWRETRLYLAERDGRRCFYCRTEFDRLRDVSIDHYIPKSVWACNLPANLVLSCEPCNRGKGDRLTWSMAAVLLAWQHEQQATVPDRHTVTVTPCRTGTGTAGREAPAAGEQPSWEPAVAACS
ncbi:HNH endonuclease [Streptomyces europaeiscabiei]|uniref:HNH endonuclease n=1 Tax=Streptomyces europaeiscabiei TaxID=146819 RepID=UPI0029AC148D|nr:HNH endonuclease [Streptomyces europaeiscabiei]MDX3841037.1 HNH endonuclease domain-containing protein [Streptomyces europaeiscabiei]